MIIEWVKREGNEKLLFHFMGWATDSLMVQNIEFSGYDMVVIYDYRNMDTSLLSSIDCSEYKSVSLVAWSFGVFVAEALGSCLPKFSSAIAVCGSPCPVNNMYGIPKRAFELTLEGLQEGGIMPFAKRQSKGSTKNMVVSLRPIEELLEELYVLFEASKEEPIKTIEWSSALVGQKDMIFPPLSLQKYWLKRGNVEVVSVDMGHYPYCEVGMNAIETLLRGR